MKTTIGRAVKAVHGFCKQVLAWAVLAVAFVIAVSAALLAASLVFCVLSAWLHASTPNVVCDTPACLTFHQVQ
jgi:hypothetical protein